MDNIIIYSDTLSSYEYSSGHPFKPSRAKQFMELLTRYTLLYEENQKVVEPDALQENLLTLFHDMAYLEQLRHCDKGELSADMLKYGLGTDDNPVSPGMYDFAVHAAGGTWTGAMKLLNDEAGFVFNPLGGFHHAGKDHAEGFCYINDIAVTIHDLLNRGHTVACIDIDAHHGNGVQDAFYDDDRVLTISLHESGKTLYPWGGHEHETGSGAGKGYNVNIPLLEGSDDEIYLFAFNEIYPPLIKKLAPDIVVAVIGADAHREDPLTHLNLTSNGFSSMLNTINRHSSKILAVGAGGYNMYKTAAMWALAWSVFCEIVPEDSFAGSVGGMMFGPETQTGSLVDAPFVLTGEKKKQCFHHAERVVTYLRQHLFPMHGL